MRKIGKRSTRSFSLDRYEAVKDWTEAPDCYSELPLKDREYTVIIDPHTGRGTYVVAKVGNIVRYTAYIDGSSLNQGFKRVSPQELGQRKQKK